MLSVIKTTTPMSKRAMQAILAIRALLTLHVDFSGVEKVPFSKAITSSAFSSSVDNMIILMYQTKMLLTLGKR